MARDLRTYIGIDLGGARGKSTALARLARSGDGVVALEVSTRDPSGAAWQDGPLYDYLAALPAGSAIAVGAPLTAPACVRCRVQVCPGVSACVDPAVVWLRTEGVELAARADQRDLDRIAAVPARGGAALAGMPPTQQMRPPALPYAHRCTEVAIHHERGLVPRDLVGQSAGPVAARGQHLRRRLGGLGYRLNHDLLEVSPRATVHALFGPARARGYRRDADPWQTRVHIVEGLTDLSFAPTSRLSREEVLRSDHCFDALLAAYTAYLWARDGWQLPAGDPRVWDEDGFIWAP